MVPAGGRKGGRTVPQILCVLRWSVQCVPTAPPAVPRTDPARPLPIGCLQNRNFNGRRDYGRRDYGRRSNDYRNNNAGSASASVDEEEGAASSAAPAAPSVTPLETAKVRDFDSVLTIPQNPRLLDDRVC